MALEIKEIQVILDKVIEKMKPFDNASGIRKAKEGIPDLYPNYLPAVEYAERISIHSEIGKFPDKLFKDRSPNQTEKEAEYVKKNYKQITLPVFIDYISTISRPFHDSNWSIKYGKDETKYEQIEQTFQKYVEEEIKFYGSIENFVRFILPIKKAIDANGIIAIKPLDIKTTQDGEEEIIDTQTLINPVPHYYSSKQIVAQEEGVYSMIHLAQKSKVSYGGTNKQIGHIFEFYDDENIYIIEQIGNFIDYKFDIRIYFNHGWEKVPIIKLMGMPNITQDGIIWQSPFLYVTDILDLIILNNSNLQISINMSVYPYKIMYGDVCEWKDTESNTICNDGIIILDDGKEKQCPSCLGTGLKSRVSPMGVMLIKPPSRTDEGDKGLTQKPIEFVSPDLSTLTFLENKIAKDEAKAREILHLHTSNSNVKGSEDMTATGMAIDLKALYAFVKTISDQTFYIYEFILDAIGWMRYREDFKEPTITYPITFDFTTEQDYIKQLKDATEAGLPPFVIYSIIYKYLQTLYFNEQKTAQIFNLIIRADRLLVLNNEDIALKVVRGTVSKAEEILHTSAINFVNELIAEDENFLQKPIEEQIKLLKEKSQEVFTAIKTSIPTPADLINNLVPTV